MPDDFRRTFGNLTPLPQESPWAKVNEIINAQGQKNVLQQPDPNQLRMKWLLKQLLLGDMGGNG